MKMDTKVPLISGHRTGMRYMREAQENMSDFTAQTARVQSVPEAFAVHTSEFAVKVEGKPKKRLKPNEAAFKKHFSFRAVVPKKRSH